MTFNLCATQDNSVTPSLGAHLIADMPALPEYARDTNFRLYATLCIFLVASLFFFFHHVLGNVALVVAAIVVGVHGFYTYPTRAVLFWPTPDLRRPLHVPVLVAVSTASLLITSYELVIDPLHNWTFMEWRLSPALVGCFLAFAVVTQGARYSLNYVAMTKTLIALLLVTGATIVLNSALVAIVGIALLYMSMFWTIQTKWRPLTEPESFKP